MPERLSYTHSGWVEPRRILDNFLGTGLLPPSEEGLKGSTRWFVASCGTFIFFLTYITFIASEYKGSVLEPSPILFPLIVGMVLTAGFGYLVAWKQPRSGPVRLFVSGVTLPAFVLYVVRISTGIEGIGG